MRAVDERLIGEDHHVGGQRCGDPLDDGFFDSAQQAAACAFAVRRPNGEFGDQVVVVLRDGVTHRVAGVESHSGSRRLVEARQRAR